MAICKWCNQEMLDADTCTGNELVEYSDGRGIPSLPYEPTWDVEPNHRCHDCGIKVGGMHHPGCDMERCPKCGGQLIGCGCLDENDDDDT